jgi:hypothetical protein
MELMFGFEIDLVIEVVPRATSQTEPERVGGSAVDVTRVDH